MKRTFVKFSDTELQFIRQLQVVVEKTTGKRASFEKVLRGIVRDYKQTLEDGAEPDFLSSYRQAGRRMSQTG